MLLVRILLLTAGTLLFCAGGALLILGSDSMPVAFASLGLAVAGVIVGGAGCALVERS